MSEATMTATPFAAMHAEFAGERGTGPAWIDSLRHDSLARFEALGIPGPRHEDWRHTSLAPLARATFRLPAERSLGSARPSSLGLDAYEAIFLNGRFAPWLSSLSGLPTGVHVMGLAEALTASPDGLRERLAQIATVDGRAFTALNTAFLEDGAYVHLEANVVADKPIHLLFYSTNAEGLPTLSQPRVLIVAERGSQARIVETYAGPEGETYFTNAVTELALEENAVIEHYKLQRESEQAFHVGRLQANLGRTSQLTSYSLSFGGGLVRTDIDVHLGGEGANCGLYGLFLGRGTQHVDHHTVIDHAVPHCSSRELYKGVLDEKAKGVFFGTVLVRPDAQKTDAQQTNKNLLLSKDALVTSTPRLQIEADDVRCKHGSTTGQIDPGAIFYLRSRGIGEAEARSLLTYAFAADVIERINVPEVKKPLASYLSMRLPGVRDLAEVGGMTSADLRELYQEVIIDHSRKPRNFGELPGANRNAQGVNPLCGDKATVFLKLEGDVVTDAGFVGAGCSISTASASMMTDAVKGKSLGEVEALFDRFRDLITRDPGGEHSSTADLGKLAVFSGVGEFPARVKCAILAWHALKAALHGDSQPVSTE